MTWQSEVSTQQWEEWLNLARKLSKSKKVITSLGPEDYAAQAIEKLVSQENRPPNVEGWLALTIKRQYIDRFKKIQDWDAYPKGLWCLEDLDGSMTFQNIPIELDLATVEKIERKIERINCGKIETRAECEIFGIKETKKILITDFGLTAAQSEDLLSCSKVRDFGEQPPDTTNAGEYIEGPWESGAPRVCIWHHWPERSAVTRFKDLDGGAKSSIIFFVLLEIFFFGLFYSAFRENNSGNNGRSTGAALVKTLLSVIGINLIIVFFVWLYIALIEPAMSGNKVDFSKKFLGVPQYMWTVIYTMYYIAWNSNRKK